MSGQEATNSLDRDPGVTDDTPIVPYRVVHAEIPFYSDPECTQEVPEAKITILEMLDPDDTLDELDVVPSRKKYEPGQFVQWTLNNKTGWEECWYRHPEKSEIERAWVYHVEFIGKLLKDQGA
jgi:hypothetical protein